MSTKFGRAPKNPQTCPGLRNFMRSTIKMVKCHTCGGDVEVWSDEDSGVCEECGAEWHKPDEDSSCLQYCEFAEKCREIIQERKQ
ncbi:MAG: hypothetical protein NWF11_07690 [Candidatus Bathyarchaeota archaeon]|nr:hypothetical protein [Candidatus Bathyarchaeota archaeon]